MRELNLDELNKSLGELQQKLIELQLERDNIQEEIDSFDVSEYISHDEYDEVLNEVYGETVNIAGSVFDTATALKELDETAYILGYNDYCDSYNKEDIPEYQDLMERLDELESKIEYTEDTIEELEEQVMELGTERS